MPRLYCPLNVVVGEPFELPDAARRHVQVLRLQPGALVDLFDGRGGAWSAQVGRMGRQQVEVLALAVRPVAPAVRQAVTLAVGLIANERMDWLVEKATELGVACIVPLVTERTIVRLSGDRASKRVAHWQAIAAAACEQSGRDLLPTIEPLCSLQHWLAQPWQSTMPVPRRGRLSLSADSRPWQSLTMSPASAPTQTLCVALGPEGGWSEAEEHALNAAGYPPISLGAAVLRTETAALTVLARWGAAA